MSPIYLGQIYRIRFLKFLNILKFQNMSLIYPKFQRAHGG